MQFFGHTLYSWASQHKKELVGEHMVCFLACYYLQHHFFCFGTSACSGVTMHCKSWPIAKSQSCILISCGWSSVVRIGPEILCKQHPQTCLQVRIKQALGIPSDYGNADVVHTRPELIPGRQCVYASHLGSNHLLLYDVNIQGVDALGQAEVWYGQVASILIPDFESSHLSSCQHCIC